MIQQLLDLYFEARDNKKRVLKELELVKKDSEMHAILSGRLQVVDTKVKRAREELNNALQTTPMAKQVFDFMHRRCHESL